MDKMLAVIGLGNISRRDDGIGIYVLEKLAGGFRRKGVDYLDFGSASLDLINRMRRYKAVVLIDAINAGLRAGELRIFDLEKAHYDLRAPFSSSHEMGLGDLFRLCRTLEVDTKVYVAGIQAADLSYGDSMTELLRERCDDIANKISAFIDSITEESEAVI